MFPETSIQCCRFHLGQSWWRKIQKIGLSTEYKDNGSNIGKWLKSFFGLVSDLRMTAGIWIVLTFTCVVVLIFDRTSKKINIVG
jgi:hypothetical protein